MTTKTTIALPETCTIPSGYRWGAHVRGSAWYLIRESDDAAIIVEQRPDLRELDEDEDPTAGSNLTHGMTPEDIQDAIEEAFAAV